VLHNSQELDNYIDGVLTHTIDWQCHVTALRYFFQRIRQANLTVRPSKCEIEETRVFFLGHTLSKGVILPRQETVDKILRAPSPRTLKNSDLF